MCIVSHYWLYISDCVQVSEVNSEGQVLSQFTDVKLPCHLSSDSEGHVLVADCDNHRILLLNSQLQRVLVDTSTQVEFLLPLRLYHNERTSQLYVVHFAFDFLIDSLLGGNKAEPCFAVSLIKCLLPDSLLLHSNSLY